MEVTPGPEPELVVYESVDVESNSEDDGVVEAANEDITTSFVTREAALEAFVGPARRVDDTVATRVARIRREIEELRRDGADVDAADLLAELQSLVRPAPASAAPVPAAAQPAQSAAGPDRVEAQREFAELESRVAKLESKLGLSLRLARSPESLAGSVAQLKRTVELLASNPESVAARVNKLAAAQASHARDSESRETRIDALYHRLAALDEAVDVLPHVVSRLQTLRFVHAEAVNQQQQFRDMQAALETMQREQQRWRAVLETLEQRVPEYIEVSRRNVEKLQH